MRLSLPRFILCLSLLLSSFAFARASSVKVNQELVSKTVDFLSVLSDTQKATALMSFSSEERFNWGYVPKDRKGVSLKELSKEQVGKVHGLLKTVLSDVGHEKIDTIMGLEKILFALEGHAHRDAELYYVSIFGEPSLTQPWGLRFEGHHVSLNFTMADGKGLSVTPHFMGANPAEIRGGDNSRIGERALGLEEDLGRALLNSLDEEQKSKAIFEARAFRDIVTKAKVEVSPLERVGIEYGALSEKQRHQLVELLHLSLDTFDSSIAERRWAELEAAGLQNISFAWAGSALPGEAHYYRVQGPSFILEYDNVQNRANHVHLVWRDFAGDFGRDLLREHYHGHSHSH